ncbi:MAG: hypothetical protein PF630_11375 [Gammaproteobacteria bacterium]|jgi:hypothetical protein|nr:hypothetical protein [Gammaproteobacteria bacterium]
MPANAHSSPQQLRFVPVLLLSVLLHVLLVVLLHEYRWPTALPGAVTAPLHIEFRLPAPRTAPAAGEKQTSATDHTGVTNAPAAGVATPDLSTPELSTPDRSNPELSTIDEPAIRASEAQPDLPTQADSEPATPFNIQQLKQQAVDAVNLAPSKRLGRPDPGRLSGSLPGNWTRDALPGSAVAAPDYLEPLSYTGPVGSRQWRADNGDIRTETILSDGTVVCARSMSFKSSSSFVNTVMLSSVCGSKTGSGQRPANQLSKYHPGNQTGNQTDNQPDNDVISHDQHGQPSQHDDEVIDLEQLP